MQPFRGRLRHLAGARDDIHVHVRVAAVLAGCIVSARPERRAEDAGHLDDRLLARGVRQTEPRLLPHLHAVRRRQRVVRHLLTQGRQHLVEAPQCVYHALLILPREGVEQAVVHRGKGSFLVLLVTLPRADVPLHVGHDCEGVVLAIVGGVRLPIDIRRAKPTRHVLRRRQGEALAPLRRPFAPGHRPRDDVRQVRIHDVRGGDAVHGEKCCRVGHDVRHVHVRDLSAVLQAEVVHVVRRDDGVDDGRHRGVLLRHLVHGFPDVGVQ
mmetsp:Transcript_32263/g.76034  ORF Transcript_32263/g.76034 Transcript_32263/m.76034 type:complete len:267 (-) Transcript_32263:800-1600(-)